MDHGEQCNMRGGTEFDGSDFFADKKSEPDWKAQAMKHSGDAAVWRITASDLSAENSLLRFQRDALAVVMFAVGLSLGWLAAVFL